MPMVSSRIVHRRLAILLACAAPIALAGAAPPPVRAAEARPLYKDSTAPIAARVDDLLKRMTLEEKVGQLLTVWGAKAQMLDANKRIDPARAAALFPHGFGGFARPSDTLGAGSPRVTPGH